MPFDSTATSEQVFAAFAPFVQDRTFVITEVGKPSIESSMAIELVKAPSAHVLIAFRIAIKVDLVLSTARGLNPAVKATFVQRLRLKTKLEVIINSAGNMALKEYTFDKQGIEMQLQAKAAKILFTYGLIDRHKQQGIISFACQRVSNFDTKLGTHLNIDDYLDIVPLTKRNIGKDFLSVLEMS
ncbi:MAG: hypothetical protein Q9191_005745 [Dirinaria sp. TL-2023a]